MSRTILILLAMSSALFGQRPLTGGYPGAFMRIGSNARDVALGSALAADINSGFLAITNPASVVYHRRREFGISYLYLPLDRSVQTLNFAIALPPTAAASLSYIRAGDNNIIGRNSIGKKTGKVAYSEQAIGLTFSNRLTRHISFGLTAKVLLQTLDMFSSQGFGIDVGLLYRRPSGLSAAIRVENVTGAYVWSIEEAQDSRDYSERLPRLLSGALRIPWWHFVLYAQVDGFFPEDGGVVNIYRLGIEDKIGEKLFIRGGMNHLTPTAGAGLIFSLREEHDSSVDYSLSLGRSGEGLGHIFSWVFSL